VAEVVRSVGRPPPPSPTAPPLPTLAGAATYDNGVPIGAEPIPPYIEGETRTFKGPVTYESLMAIKDSWWPYRGGKREGYENADEMIAYLDWLIKDSFPNGPPLSPDADTDFKVEPQIVVMAAKQGGGSSGYRFTPIYSKAELRSRSAIFSGGYPRALEQYTIWLSDPANKEVADHLDEQAATMALLIRSEQRKFDMAIGVYMGGWALPAAGVLLAEGLATTTTYILFNAGRISTAGGIVGEAITGVPLTVPVAAGTGAAFLDVAERTFAAPASSAVQRARLSQHLGQLEKYGTQGFIELESGSIRYFGNLKLARTSGEMAGTRVVREWDPLTDGKLTWLETLDHNGTVRIVRPERGGAKVHYVYDAASNLIETR
jgi:hypothetical protein